MNKRPFLFSLVGTSINTLGLLSPRLGASVAMYLFQRPRRKKLKEDEIKFLESAKISFSEGEEDIAYYRWGSEEKFVLLNHGWESGAIRWKPYIDQLLDLGYSVIAADAPGHGLSTTPKFNAYLYSKALYPLIRYYQPQLVIGHSIGGFVSVLTGAELQDYQPKHYILLAPNNKISDTFATYQEMIGMSNRVMKAALESVPDITPEKRPIEYFASEELMKKISVPIDIIHDRDDKLLPITESNKLGNLFENVTVHETQGYGHRLKSNDIVDRVIALIKQFTQ